MKWSWQGGRGRKVPPGVRSAMLPYSKERILAWTVTSEGEVLVVGARSVMAVVDQDGSGRMRLRRKWHTVDSAVFDAAASTLTVVWVDGDPPEVWTLSEEAAGTADVVVAFRERVQASVVLAETVAVGPGRTARVVIRRDLATGALLCQELLGAGVDRAEPGVQRQLDAAVLSVKEQVGLV